MAKYFDNKKFIDTLIMYRSNGGKKEANILGKMMISVANHYIYKPLFINYPQYQKNEMISDAIYYMWKYLKNFSEDFDNAFAYLSTTTYNAFVAVIKKYYKNKDIQLPIHFLDNIDSFSGDRAIIKIDDHVQHSDSDKE